VSGRGGQPVTFGGVSPDDVIFDAALASHAEDNDAIDVAVIEQARRSDARRLISNSTEMRDECR
jgi:hypothetical protein